MPLPAAGSNWPPAPYGPAYAQYDVNAAWLEGDTERLGEIYGPGTNGQLTGTEHMVNGRLFRGGLKGLRDRWFNGRPVASTGAGSTASSTRLHAPLASDVASLSADLLMSEPPKIRMLRDNDVVEGAHQDALDVLLNSDRSRIALRRGFEWSAGIGGVAFTWAWAAGVNENYPWLQAHAADTVIPRYTQGFLTSVAVVDTYPLSGEGYLRHIMSHDPGVITHGLFIGRIDKLGQPEPFDSQVVKDYAPHLAELLATPKTANVSPKRDQFSIATGTQRLTATFVPNKPTLTFRREGPLSFIGRADIEGAEPFLDAHDEAWSSLMRDMKIGRGRVLVDQSLLESLGAGYGASFDDLQEFFSPLQSGVMGGADSKMADMVSAQQFDIRVEEHLAIARETAGVVYDHAGYSPSAYGAAGENGNGATTATDSVDRAKKTERTRDSKILPARLGLKDMALSGLELTNAIVGAPSLGAFEPKELDISFPDVSQIDPEKDARTYSTLRGATIISRYLSVKYRYPDFTEKEVLEEVERIEKENQSVGVSPFDIGRPPVDEEVDPENAEGANDASANDQAGTAAPQGN